MIAHLKATWNYRYFWMSLVKMDVLQRYRKSVLGLGWSLLNPLAMTAVFCLVFSSLMKPAGKTWQEYACYLISGITVWNFLVSSLGQGCTSFIRNELYIRQCPLPCSIYPMRTVLSLAFHLLIGLGLVMSMVVVLMGSMAPFKVLWAVLPVVVLMILFAWAVATLASFATIYFHDTQHLVEVGAQLMFFLTPIMYERSLLDNNNIGFLADLNPAFIFMQLIRGPFLSGVPADSFLYFQAVALTTVTVGLAIGAIAWLEKKMIFQL